MWDDHNTKNLEDKQMANFNTNRKFGIEIEFKSNRQAVADYMNAHGVSCVIEGYNHTTKSHWKIVTDASAEFELVSPPIHGTDGLRQLKIACDALSAAGAKVDRTCGLHVHHDANDLTTRQFANVFALYIKLEETIDTFQPESRRGNNNHYCASLALTASEKNAKLAQLKKAKTIEEIAGSVFCGRYFKVNAQSYLRYGTVEFRQHSGTIEYEKMYNWILLTQRIVERAIEGNVQYAYKVSTVKMLTLQKMLGIIASCGADEEITKMNNWFLKRAAQLSAA
jgi:hypothetical protein